VVQEPGERPELAEAATVVSGGRGVGSADGFELIDPDRPRDRQSAV